MIGSDLAFVVLGAGAMGRIVARDLVETAPDASTVVIGDLDERRAQNVMRECALQGRRVKIQTIRVDAFDVRQTQRLLRDSNAFAVINALQHQCNLHVMKAALGARAHYCDLGGLFHYTRKQLQHHATWKKADRLALLGIGAAPGIVNVLARSAADAMESVREIHVYVASIDRTKGRPALPLEVSYSPQTVLEEASQDAAMFTNGKLTFVPAMSQWAEVKFPRPIGKRRTVCTIHSELATLPLSYRHKGIQECTFRIAFPERLVEKLLVLREVGMLSQRLVTVGGIEIAPREFLATVLRQQPRVPDWDGLPEEDEVLRVVVRGTRSGVRVEEVVDCHTSGVPEWKVGADINTGCPSSIAVQMLARGEIAARGCVPPERAIPFEAFFRELERRRITIRRRTTRLSRHP